MISIKKFSHRGLIKDGIKENSLEAFKNAYQNNFRAIEFDIWYLKNQLVLKHNRPSNLNNLTTLEGLFCEIKNKVEYWLDFKNLNSKNCDSAVKEVRKIVDNLKIKPSQIYFAPFITDFVKAKIIYQAIRKYFDETSQIVAVIEKLDQKNYQKFYQQLKENNIYGLSIEHKNINIEFKNIFYDIKIFAWTVNDQKTSNLLAKIGIENIATDKLLP